jgi:hypothetical protein
MNHEFKRALSQLGGKTIAHVVVKQGVKPVAQLFLLFTDGTYYELFSDSAVTGAAALDRGGLPEVLAAGAPNQKVIYQC